MGATITCESNALFHPAAAVGTRIRGQNALDIDVCAGRSARQNVEGIVVKYRPRSKWYHQAFTLAQLMPLSDDALFQSAPLPAPTPPGRTYQLPACAAKADEMRPATIKTVRQNFFRNMVKLS